jgi:hypothetical protein
MFVVDASAAARRVPLHPNSPYAKVADLASLAARGDEVVAIGAAHGGAHANFRWTVWAGSTQRLDDYPQTFETFGGQSAGGLSNIVFTSDGPVIAGTWAAKEGGGLDTASMAAPRPAVDSPGVRWHRAGQHRGDSGRTSRGKRRRLDLDHFWLRDHFRRRC